MMYYLNAHFFITFILDMQKIIDGSHHVSRSFINNKSGSYDGKPSITLFTLR